MYPVGTITPEEIKERLRKGEQLTVIDVREPDEVALGMIPGAIHIPLAAIPVRSDEIPEAEEIILVCRSGNRSGRACEYLQQSGVKGLKNMLGGMMAWDETE